MGQTIENTANGVIVRDENGRFLPGTKPANLITPANARELQAKRVEQYRRAAARGALRAAAAIDPTVSTPGDAWALLTERQYQQIMDSEKPQSDAYNATGAAIGARPTAAELRQVDDSGSVTLTVPAPVVSALLDRLSILLDVTPRE